jgi:hypothetical protein
MLKLITRILVRIVCFLSIWNWLTFHHFRMVRSTSNIRHNAPCGASIERRLLYEVPSFDSDSSRMATLNCCSVLRFDQLCVVLLFAGQCSHSLPPRQAFQNRPAGCVCWQCFRISHGSRVSTMMMTGTVSRQEVSHQRHRPSLGAFFPTRRDLQTFLPVEARPCPSARWSGFPG